MSGILDWIAGDASGVEMPAHPEALQKGGAKFLTHAFRSDSMLDPDDAVTEVVLAQECQGGSTGRKMRLRVRYRDPANGLPEHLFVKFSRAFGDEIRDRGRFQMEAEVRMGRLSRTAGFPVAVPRCMFADYHAESGTGILISEEIPFGRYGIEPHREKCLDAETLAHPAEHYQALVRANARLGGTHRAGGFPDGIIAPLADRSASLDVSRREPYSAEQLGRRIERLREFAQSYPALVPEVLREPAFLNRFAEEALAFCGHEERITGFLDGNERYNALSHWNANIDNAWFWRNDGGELKCGLLDWGNTRVMNVGVALAGSLMAAEPDFLVANLDNLVASYVAEFQATCGEELDPEEVKLQLFLHNASSGLLWLIDAPTLIVRACPELESISSRSAPEFRANEFLRSQLHMLINFLTLWRHFGFGGVLQRFLQSR